ncbi:MAG: 3-oxoacyl-ACP reductase [Alcaligenaceae bacterium]|nr:MAG: 3-oxoacyl-ACP reductase [Alcaligenaceae bacterium]
MVRRLEGKVALVTGAGCVGPGWGNGRAIAVRFAQEGARVFAVDKDLSTMTETLALIAEASGEVTPYQCNVLDGKAIPALVAACVKQYGGIDILVNNVGGGSPGGPITLSEESWDAQMNINLKTVFMMCKYVMPVMLEKGAGSIVNIASISGIRWSGAAQVGYAASKAGVIQFGRVVAVEYASKGIRINSVLPGQLHTPLVEVRVAKNQSGGDVEAILKRRQARIPMPFMGDGRDTANAALFLASDEARFITGTELIVDGGMTAKCD